MKGLTSWRPAVRPDYLVVGATIAAIAVAGVLVVVLPGPALKAVSGIGGALATFVARNLAKRLSMERTARRYRQLAEDEPISLFDVRPPVDDPALGSRARLMESVTAELEDQVRDGALSPILVVGEAGSGKTTFAAGLAKHLAKRNRIPVVISLRDRGDEIDFEAEARKRFAEFVERRNFGRDGTSVWDYLRRAGRCVVIADGLDERVLDSRARRVTAVTERILAAESARSIPLVVTSRPDGLHDTRLIEAVSLGPLPEEYVAKLLFDDCRGRLSERDAREVTRQLALPSRPLYLTVARDVGKRAAAGSTALLTSIAATADTDLARYKLLDERLETFMAQDRGIRTRSVDTVSVLALIALIKGETAASITGQEEPRESWLRHAAGAPLNRREAIAAAVDLRFLRIEGDTVGFRHPIIQTYLASRALELIPSASAAEPEWTPLLDAGTPDEVLRALRMYATRLALRGEDGESRIGALARDLVDLTTSARLVGSERLALLATAAHALGSAGVQREGALASERADLARLIASGWEVECPQAAKAEAIGWLARMSGDAALLSVWSIAVEDDSYAFRWEAVEAMAESGAAARDALVEMVQPMLNTCAEWTSIPDAPGDALPEDVVRGLSIVAKFLPSGNEAGADTAGAGLDSPAAEDLTTQLAEVVRDMSARDRALGVEASLAQGLKHAARRYPLTDRNLAEAETLAAQGHFWYTRIMALHALVRHAIAIEDTRLADRVVHETMGRVETCLAAARDDDHPWVSEAAAQGQSALAHMRERGTDPARAFVWHDEAGQVSRASHELDDATCRLLAEVALVLNMNEQGSHAVPVDGRLVPHSSDRVLVAECEMCRRQLEVGTKNVLPQCLSGDRSRDRVLDPELGCSCSFNLCPYDFTAYLEVRHAHRGQLSPQFCARQRVIARSLGSPPWQPDLSVDSYADFWKTMERRARDERAATD